MTDVPDATAADGPLVVKLGGGMDPGPALDDLAALAAHGRGLVVVHGGGAEADRLSAQLGLPVRTVTSPDGTRGRRTDDAALDVLAMALLGRVKPALVHGLRARGVAAAGVSGADGGLLTAERKTALRSVENGRTRLLRDDRSGRVTGVRPGILHALLAQGLVPVVSPPAADATGSLLNVDSDQVAAALAEALPAAALVLLTDAPGVLADPADPGSLIARLPCGPEVPAAATGRMRHKVRAAARARRAGVGQVVIAHGHTARPVRTALAGGGTAFAGPGEELG
ncbi:[LysW]-aminoadipate kinase [Streptomyces sp. NPDC015171]|uniref:[LysW]-aminoadipate kinase n=1 Tax=Streptomyces sp. NPDC015171 TaxID=3364945 RepID=UPI003701D2B3